MLVISSITLLFWRYIIFITNSYCCMYNEKVWWGESLANWLFLNIWRKKVWRINRSANRLLIESTTLNDFSLANHGRFIKFIKLSLHQTFPLYGIFWRVSPTTDLRAIGWKFVGSEGSPALYISLIWAS